jgi:hypothetical protein
MKESILIHFFSFDILILYIFTESTIPCFHCRLHFRGFLVKTDHDVTTRIHIQGYWYGHFVIVLTISGGNYQTYYRCHMCSRSCLSLQRTWVYCTPPSFRGSRVAPSREPEFTVHPRVLEGVALLPPENLSLLFTPSFRGGRVAPSREPEFTVHPRVLERVALLPPENLSLLFTPES